MNKAVVWGIAIIVLIVMYVRSQGGLLKVLEQIQGFSDGLKELKKNKGDDKEKGSK